MPVVETRFSTRAGIKECLAYYISLEKDENEIGKIEAGGAPRFGAYFGEHKDQKADIKKADALLSLRDGCPEYYVVFSGQGKQTLANGIRLIDIGALIKGDLEEL